MKILYLLVAALKFVGILILVLLLLLLLIIMIILAVPIKYRISVNKSEEIDMDANIKWLYSAVNMDILYNSKDKVKKKLKLFGFKLDLNKPKKVKTFKESKGKKSQEKASVKLPRETPREIPTKLPKEDSPKQPSYTGKEEPQKVKTNKKTGIKEMMNQIQAFDYKRDLLSDTIGWIGDLFKSIGPEYFYIYLEIGREDPADTGQLMALLSALYPYYYPAINIVGNYEKECLYGKLDISGDAVIGRLIYDFIKYIRTPSMKELIKIIRESRKGKGNGRKTSK